LKIEQIKQESKQLIDKVTCHKKMVESEVEAFRYSLKLKRNGLDQTELSINYLILKANMSERIRRKKKITKELEIDFGNLEISEPPVLIKKGEMLSVCYKTLLM